MATDLFALFPDLPWPRIGHPPARVWPPSLQPRQLFQDRDRDAARAAALRQIYAIAVSERRRLRAGSAGARALDQIIEIAREVV
jgi:hypothetical protein